MKSCPHCGKVMQHITQGPAGPYWHCGCGQDVYDGDMTAKNSGSLGPRLPSETHGGKGRAPEFSSISYRPHGRVPE